MALGTESCNGRKWGVEASLVFEFLPCTAVWLLCANLAVQTLFRVCRFSWRELTDAKLGWPRLLQSSSPKRSAFPKAAVVKAYCQGRLSGNIDYVKSSNTPGGRVISGSKGAFLTMNATFIFSIPGFTREVAGLLKFLSETTGSTLHVVLTCRKFASLKCSFLAVVLQ